MNAESTPLLALSHVERAETDITVAIHQLRNALKADYPNCRVSVVLNGNRACYLIDVVGDYRHDRSFYGFREALDGVQLLLAAAPPSIETIKLCLGVPHDMETNHAAE